MYATSKYFEILTSDHRLLNFRREDLPSKLDCYTWVFNDRIRLRHWSIPHKNCKTQRSWRRIRLDSRSQAWRISPLLPVLSRRYTSMTKGLLCFPILGRSSSRTHRLATATHCGI
ncbi:hypothetical protein CsSME_00048003 [Camellia sinensis var. sinensis]